MPWPRSQPSSCSTRWRSHPPPHRGHHRRKSSSPISSPLPPSATLLSILASIVSASTANASPTPPSFLCPSIASDAASPPSCYGKRTPSLESVPKIPSRPQESGRSKLRHLPDKFVEGDDGNWRRVRSYTLYGVTSPNPSCDNAEGCPPAQIPPIATNKTITTPVPVDIQLPPGWNPSPQSPNSRTTMILAVSLALSLFICFLIVICLFWRKGLINKKQACRDLETEISTPRQGQGQNAEEQRNIEVEREAKALQKIWARASARWKANARYSLRQRTGTRLYTRSHHHQSTTSLLNDSRTPLDTHTSGPSSSILPSPNTVEVELRDQQRPNYTSRFSSPPAYHATHQIPPIIISSPEQTTGSISECSAPSQQPSQVDLASYLTTAHVATDDKTLLARLADLASAPPDETDTVANMSSLSQVSAPENLEFDGYVVSPTSTQMDTASLFPPPPSKERLAAAERLEYTFGYDNLENTEPEPEPSAPPFEESSAIPPLDGSILLPCAPSVIDDEEGRGLGPIPTCLPSAPSLEDVLVVSYAPEQCLDKHD